MSSLNKKAKCNKCLHFIEGKCDLGQNIEYVDNECWMFNHKEEKEVVSPASHVDVFWHL